MRAWAAPRSPGSSRPRASARPACTTASIDGEIQHLIRRLGLRPGLDHDHRTDHGSLGPGQWWLATLAREIGMPAATLFGWLRRGWITGRQDTRPPYRWIITADHAEVERLRALHQLPAGYHNRRRWTDDGTPIDTSNGQGAR